MIPESWESRNATAYRRGRPGLRGGAARFVDSHRRRVLDFPARAIETPHQPEGATSLFAYILRVHQAPSDETNEFFRRFKDTPGLLHAYSLQSEDDPNDSVAIAIWESREAAERYLQSSPLKRDVDQAMPTVTRTFYAVVDSK